ncbi:MAG: penicillin-binding protein 2 [Bacteroidales bacterium]|nr:penicillin-binding protein 2 [Bacteroidales bacterium]
MNTDGRHIRLLIGLGVATLLLLGKLISLQLLDNSYKENASKNVTIKETIYPTRGVIYDRNRQILVGNKVAYDIMVDPKMVQASDTAAIAAVAAILQQEPDFIREKLDEFRRKGPVGGTQEVTLLRAVPAEVYMRLDEVKYNFPGFRGQVRSIREYPVNAGGNLLGYVSEVSPDYIRRHNGEYTAGDYAGMTGIEAAREKDLRGEKGYHIYLRNSRNQREGSYKDGAEDKEAVPGRDIVTTIDAPLQQYGQQLMRNKVGSVVAIEPSTGEILALVSSPGIDVDKLADIGKYWKEISANPYKPMYNRAVQASYPPGSVFKLVNGLIGLQEGVLRPETVYSCYKGYSYGEGRKLGCHSHKTSINMDESIMMSCNAYYCYVFKSILDQKKFSSVAEALDYWREMVMSFGFGKKLGSDFPAELSGSIPSSATYNSKYRRWNSTTVISLSIGQGEILATPMHLANFCATVANRGYYYIPHIIKETEGVPQDPRFSERHYTLVDTTQFPKVIPGMWKAVNAPAGMGGTAHVARVDGLEICGKTGTAQNPRGADNSVFICFAPKDNPKIAIAAYVENGGFGAAYAAPIASLMVEKYLTGTVSRKDLERSMKQSNLLYRVKRD